MDQSTPRATRCPRCGSNNRCGFGQDTPCWCATAFAPVVPLESSADACYCQSCLTALIKENVDAHGGSAPFT
jgi:hypothetical protein